MRQSILLSYSLQVLAIALSVLAFRVRRGRVDFYTLTAISIWTVVVIAIYFKYREDQVFFYSNDQLWHQQLISVYLKAGIHLNIPDIISNRYIITIPAMIASKFGVNAMLAIKAMQLVFLLCTYDEAKKFILDRKTSFSLWHMYLIVGPTSLFISTLALRDTVIVYFTVICFLRSTWRPKLIALVFVFLLRPHLAVAIFVGSVASTLIGSRHKKWELPNLMLGSIILYAFGAFSYFVGANIQAGLPFRLPESVFAQAKFTRLFANFVGLQFLTLGPSVVNLQIGQLLLSRVIFIESLLVPVLFLLTILRHREQLGAMKQSLLFSFIFLYGLTSQTDWNSSRQNLPFLAVMATLGVASLTLRMNSREVLKNRIRVNAKTHG